MNARLNRDETWQVGKKAMRSFRVTQQEIVFVVFALLFLVCSLFLKGFLTSENILTLIQNVSVLGILGLAMAIVVIGGGIDISLIATLAVPSGLVLQLVQNGHSLTASIVTAFAISIAFGLVNGWLIAFAEVPSLFATLATGIFLAGFGQAFLFQVDVVQWSDGMNGFDRLGQGSVLGVPMPIILFALAAVAVAFLLRRTRWGAYIYAVGDNYSGGTRDRDTDPPDYRAAIRDGRAYWLLRRLSACGIGQFDADADFQLDTDLRCHSRRGSGRHWPFRGARRSHQCDFGYVVDRNHAERHDHFEHALCRTNLVKGVVLLAAVIADSFLNPRNEETAQQGDI